MRKQPLLSKYTRASAEVYRSEPEPNTEEISVGRVECAGSREAGKILGGIGNFLYLCRAYPLSRRRADVTKGKQSVHSC